MSTAHSVRAVIAAVGLGFSILVTATFVTPAPAGAHHLAAVTVIGADQLKRWIDANKPMTLVDSRVAAEYKTSHIPTALNILATAMERERARLPGNKHAVLVFYCNGWPECKKSHEAASKVVEWGYQNVFWLRDGLPAWQAKGYPVE
jgi:rhodanese-related sulfurtransferase